MNEQPSILPWVIVIVGSILLWSLIGAGAIVSTAMTPPIAMIVGLTLIALGIFAGAAALDDNSLLGILVFFVVFVFGLGLVAGGAL